MSLNQSLLDLKDQLHLLNLQLTARAHGEESLTIIKRRLVILQTRTEQCRSALTREYERLLETKALCQGILEDLPLLSPTSSAIPMANKKGTGLSKQMQNNSSQPSSQSQSHSQPQSSSQSQNQFPSIMSISEEEFETVPRYMRGRLTRDRVNGGVELFNRSIRDKYTFLALNPSRMTPDQRQRYYDLRDMEGEEVVGRFFVTEADMKLTLTNINGKSTPSTVMFKFDSTGRAILAIMRHLGRIKEIRGGGIVRYVISTTNFSAACE